ncbi:MAG TPA: L-histidine N(alpha)-methyltransferase [Haliangium sp.]|nr:L-histidine N(alpha)-methyltransferase [Haliangium sp.]
MSRDLPEIPARYFYDDHGSALFEVITELPVYYQTRTEIAILERHAAEIIERVRPRHLVELGSGAGRKIRLLLDAWLASSARSARHAHHAPQPLDTRPTQGGPPGERGRSCTMLDINAAFLHQSLERLRVDYSGCVFHGVVGDFTADLHRLGPGTDRLIVFFAGTIGNLHPDERRQFLGTLSDMMTPGDALLVGLDLVKDRAELEAAYNDPQGITEAFNRNMLAVINRRFDGDFAPDAFAHRAFYDAENAWIEMRLRALRPMRVHLRAPGLGTDVALDLAEGAEIRTEISCKFTQDSVTAAAHEAGLGLAGWFTDPAQRFALALLRRSDA